MAKMIGVLYMLVSVGCEAPPKEIPMPETDLSSEYLIPMPSTMVATNSAFKLDQYTRVVTSPVDGDLVDVANYLTDKIAEKTGLRLANK